MLKTIKDDDARLSLLGNYLEGIKGTVFRQTQFAEFELRMHEMAEKGQPITGEALDKLYCEITRKYYGHDKGVCIVDDYVAHEWAFIPHFYHELLRLPVRDLVHRVGGARRRRCWPAIRRRRSVTSAFLSAGGSKYPIELLKDAGVDMTTDEPLRADAEEDEPGDGRDGEAAGQAAAEVGSGPRHRPLEAARLPEPGRGRCGRRRPEPPYDAFESAGFLPPVVSALPLNVAP